MNRPFYLASVLALCVYSAGAWALGPLLFRPAERAEINLHGRLTPPPDTVPEPAPAPNAEPPVPVAASPRLDGVIRRSSGRWTAWVDGQMQHEDETQPWALRLLPQGWVRVVRPQQVPPMKPGQVWDAEQGRVVEPWMVRQASPPSVETPAGSAAASPVVAASAAPPSSKHEGVKTNTLPTVPMLQVGSPGR